MPGSHSKFRFMQFIIPWLVRNKFTIMFLNQYFLSFDFSLHYLLTFHPFQFVNRYVNSNRNVSWHFISYESDVSLVATYWSMHNKKKIEYLQNDKKIYMPYYKSTYLSNDIIKWLKYAFGTLIPSIGFALFVDSFGSTGSTSTYRISS